MIAKETVTISIDVDVELEVTGIYDEGEPERLYPVDDAHPGSKECFEITEVSISKGNPLDLLHWCSEELYFANGYGRNSPERVYVSIFEVLEERCLSKINNNK